MKNIAHDSVFRMTAQICQLVYDKYTSFFLCIKHRSRLWGRKCNKIHKKEVYRVQKRNRTEAGKNMVG